MIVVRSTLGRTWPCVGQENELLCPSPLGWVDQGEASVGTFRDLTGCLLSLGYVDN